MQDERPIVAAHHLASRLGISREGVSKTPAKPERRDPITRSVNPADRRAALISVTGTGQDVIDDLFPRELEAHTRLLAGFGQDRERVVDALPRFAEVMGSRIDGTTT